MKRSVSIFASFVLWLGNGMASDYHILMKDAVSINPNPFWCNSIPQFPSCAQPAIPICCGPCYQAQPAAGGGTAPAGGGTAPAGGGTAPAGGGTAPAGGGAAPAGGGTAPAGGGTAPAGGGAAPAGGGTAPAGGGTAPAGGEAGGAGTAAQPTAGAAPAGGAGAGAATAAPGGAAAGGAGGATAAPAGGGATATGNCPIACPPGWSTWGLSESCYLMPTQPLHSDDFWTQQAYCKSKEPTSNILVIDGLIEQALVTGVALQYAPSWGVQGTNIFLWFGCYTSPEGWKCVDGTDQSKSPLMLIANIAQDPKQNGSCIGAEAKTLGAWQTYPCTDKTGAVICEMPKRPVCGPTGGTLPVGGIALTPDKLKDLFPKAPSIPYIASILAGGLLSGEGLKNVVGSVGNVLTNPGGVSGLSNLDVGKSVGNVLGSVAGGGGGSNNAGAASPGSSLSGLTTGEKGTKDNPAGGANVAQAVQGLGGSLLGGGK